MLENTKIYYFIRKKFKDMQLQKKRMCAYKTSGVMAFLNCNVAAPSPLSQVLARTKVIVFSRRVEKVHKKR